MQAARLSTGIPSLDHALERIMPGDNVVWLVSSPEQYDYFAARFIDHCVQNDLGLVYVHFDSRIDYSKLPHAGGVEVIEVDPGQGPAAVADDLMEQIRARGYGGHYLFDSLSVLSGAWHDDEAFIEFFRTLCPLLYDMEAVAYFALVKGRQSNGSVAKIRDTTQILLEVYEDADRVYIQPIKVWDRYSQTMFQPHVLAGEQVLPLGRAVGGAAQAAPSEADLLAGYQERTGGERSLSIREELIRTIVSNRPEYIRIARDYFSVEDLIEIKSRTLGSGTIGGKAAGMLLSNRLLREVCAHEGRQDVLRRLREPQSFFLGSDVYFNFLINNNLMHWLDLKYREPAQMLAEFPALSRQFQAGRFPRAIREALERVVRTFRGKPIIVRSSSLLEDSLNMAFAGKYESVFLGNQGNEDECLEQLLAGVKRVFASSLGPDALAYRRRHGLLEFQERMAVLIQRVEGTPYRDMLFPAAAGVAFSRNPYPWSERIDAAAGLVRLVFGLGTRAVNRVEADYPRLVALSHPTVHPDGDYGKSLHYHQKHMDVIELGANALRTVPIHDRVAGDYPAAYYIFSVFKDGYLSPPAFRNLSHVEGTLAVSFDNLLSQTNFVDLVRYVLRTVESSYRYPVDIEFTLDVGQDGEVGICLLQCRPLTQRTEFRPAELPSGLPEDRVLFTARKAVPNGELHGLRYIALIDTRGYDAVPSNAVRSRLARAVGAVNHHPQVVEGGFALIGPGRWGSVAIELGVPVTYAEINNARLLIEMARPRGGYTPEVSYGTHFFQDLVESEIFYLPIYPEDPTCRYNQRFFDGAPNALPELLPDCADVAPYLKLIDVPAASSGLLLHVAMSQPEATGICYLAPPDGAADAPAS